MSKRVSVPHMNPICKTYEELKRCKERMIGVKVNFIQTDDLFVLKISTIINKIEEAISLIPEEYQKTRHELGQSKR